MLYGLFYRICSVDIDNIDYKCIKRRDYMNYSTDRPIDTEEQDLLEDHFFQNSLERQFMNIMKKMDW